MAWPAARKRESFPNNPWSGASNVRTTYEQYSNRRALCLATNRPRPEPLGRLSAGGSEGLLFLLLAALFGRLLLLPLLAISLGGGPSLGVLLGALLGPPGLVGFELLLPRAVLGFAGSAFLGQFRLLCCATLLLDLGSRCFFTFSLQAPLLGFQPGGLSFLLCRSPR